MTPNEINEINEVINNICEKIGIGIESAKNFVPMFAKYEITNSVCWMLFWSLFLIGGIFLIIKLKQKINQTCNEYKKDDYLGYLALDVIVVSIIFFIEFILLINIIKWSLCPEIMTIKYIFAYIQ